MEKPTKTAVLQHWFGIDQVLFGAPASKHLSDDAFDQYLSTKGALLSNLFEVYKKIDFTTDVKFASVLEMAKSGNQLGADAKKRALQLLENTSVTQLVKQEIKEIGDIEGLSEEQVARYVITKRRNAIAMDSMMLETNLTNENREGLADWQGKVLVDAHKTLRDSLIDISLT